MGATGTRGPNTKAASASSGRRLSLCTRPARQTLGNPRRGTTSVELALTLPFLLLLLFAVIEWGMIGRDAIALRDAVRGLSRDAALGHELSTASVDSPGLVSGRLTISCELSAWDEASRSFGEWVPGDAADAESGDRVLVSLSYRHPLLFAGFCVPSSMVTEGDIVTLDAEGMATRE